jgi:hypothetical protein
MMQMLLTIVPATLAGTAVLAFFWTLVLRINDLEKRLTQNEQQLVDERERTAALLDLRLTRAADEMSFDLRRVQLAYQELRSMIVIAPAAGVPEEPAAKRAAQGA